LHRSPHAPPEAGLVIRPLQPDDAPELAALLSGQPSSYVQHFHPFRFDLQVVSTLLRERQRDCYMGLWIGARLVGFFMLRGFDQGYTVPSFGVLVDRDWRGRGLGRLALEVSKTMCRLLAAEKLMLKVHPSNAAARALYESEGFVQTAVDPAHGHLVYHLELPGSTS
jgi:RimJ/RimL family protein N-acetyltransferase